MVKRTAKQEAAQKANWTKLQLTGMQVQLSHIVWSAVLSDYEQEGLLRVLERLERFIDVKYKK